MNAALELAHYGDVAPGLWPRSKTLGRAAWNTTPVGTPEELRCPC
jgi:hypothetical protein